jgi:hypothetical protein
MVHRHVWYNGHGLTMRVSLMVSVRVWGLWIQLFCDQDVAIPNGWSL